MCIMEASSSEESYSFHSQLLIHGTAVPVFNSVFLTFKQNKRNTLIGPTD